MNVQPRTSIFHLTLLFVRHARFDDGDGFEGHVCVGAFIPRGDAFHFIDDAVTLGDLSEYRVSPPLRCLGGMIQKIIIFHIDEELACGAVGIRGPGHGNGIRVVFKHVVRFIDDGVFCGFLGHIFSEPASVPLFQVDNGLALF
jgi:hypothetical protein